MLVLSGNDVARLSAACRAELMAVLLSTEHAEAGLEDGQEFGYLDEQTDERNVVAAADAVPGMQHVVDLTVDQASKLVDNLNDDAKETLEVFALGKRLSKSSLFGPDAGCKYANAKVFGRTVVGAVKRRLRKVTRIDNATLFMSDRSNTYIYVSDKTAQSLRVALEVDEPLPDFQFIDHDGNYAPATSEPCRELLERLKTVWKGFSVRPANLSAAAWAESALCHLAKSDVQLFVGEVNGFDDAECETYAIRVVTDPQAEIQRAFEDRSFIDRNVFFFGTGIDSRVMATPTLL